MNAQATEQPRELAAQPREKTLPHAAQGAPNPAEVRGDHAPLDNTSMAARAAQALRAMRKRHAQRHEDDSDTTLLAAASGTPDADTDASGTQPSDTATAPQDAASGTSSSGGESGLLASAWTAQADTYGGDLDGLQMAAGKSSARSNTASSSSSAGSTGSFMDTVNESWAASKAKMSSWFDNVKDGASHVSPTMLAGVLAAGVGGAVLIAGSNSDDDSAGASAGSTRTMSVTVLAGPLTQAVKVEAFDKDGTLVASATTDATGKVDLAIPAGYTGALLLKASSLNGAGITYTDEATGATATYTGTLRALLDSPDSSKVSITPLSELAVRKLGVTTDAATVDAATAKNVEHQIALLLGVASVNGPATHVLDDAYDESNGLDDAERAGQLLAQLSGADGATGGMNATLTALVSAIDLNSGTLSTAGQDLLSTGRALFASGQNGALATLLPAFAAGAPSAGNSAAAATALATGALVDGKVDAAEAATGLALSVALPATAVVGDTITVTLAPAASGTSEVAQTATHVVTRADVVQGYAAVGFTAAQLVAAGDGMKLPSMTVTNAHGTSSLVNLGPFDLDAPPQRDVVLPPPRPEDLPTPTIRLSTGYDSTLNMQDPGIKLDIRYQGLQDGDLLQPMRDGHPIGTVHRVSNAEQQAGVAQLSLNLSDLGADGYMQVSIIATNTIGTANTSNALSIHLDATPPASSMAPATGSDTFVNAGESSTGFVYTVTWNGMEAGDTVVLTLAQNGGAAVPLGQPYVVTAGDVTNGFVSFTSSVADLGGNGSKVLSATVTDLASNTGTPSTLNVVVDLAAPEPALTIDTTRVQDSYINRLEGGIDLKVAYLGMEAGDVIHLVNSALSSNPGSITDPAIAPAHTVTAAEALAKELVISVVRGDMGGDGPIDAYAVVEDAAHNIGASQVVKLHLDTRPPEPHLGQPVGDDQYLNSLEGVLTFKITDDHMTEGDWVQMTMNNGNVGPAHQVTQLDLTNGYVTMTLSDTDLGGNGIGKLVRAAIVDAAGNTGTSAALTVIVDTDVPDPSVDHITGESNYMGVDSSGNAITSRTLKVSYHNMAAGDTIQLDKDGTNFGAVHTVTASEVSAGHADILVQRTQLGLDNPYSLHATVTDAAHNQGVSGSYLMTLDQLFHP